MKSRPRSGRQAAALRAWKTMRGPVWKAQRSERLSKTALEEWAKKKGAVKAVPIIVLHDGERLPFLGGEPSFTTEQAAARRKAR